MHILSYLFPQTVEKVYSKYNGEIRVTRFCGRISIEAGGLMQSGKFLEETWWKLISNIKFPISNIPASPAGRQYKIPNTKYKILILGLGGGSIIHVLNRKFPKAQITGVDIDKEIVTLGKKYNGLDQTSNLTIKIADALKFIASESKKKKKYDLIFVDLYWGYTIPSQFQTASFLKQLDQILLRGGIVIFNRLKIQMNNPEAKQFLDKLRNIFQYVNTTTILATTLVVANSKTARPLKVT